MKQYEPLVLCIDQNKAGFVVTTKRGAKQRKLETVPLDKPANPQPDGGSGSRKSLMSKAALDRLTKRSLVELNADVENPAAYRKRFRSIQPRLTAMLVFAQVAERYKKDVTWSANAVTVQAIAFHLRTLKQRSATGYTEMKAGVAEIERIVAGGKVAAKKRPEIEEDKELPRLMKRMEQAFKRLKAARGEKKPTAVQIQAALDEATLIAVIANLVENTDGYADDDDWTAGAKKLQVSSRAIKDVKTLKSQLAVVGRSCSTCHESYR